MIKYKAIKERFCEVYMEEYMNEPVDYKWDDKDIIKAYNQCQDKRKVSRIYDIPVKEINQILKRNGVI